MEGLETTPRRPGIGLAIALLAPGLIAGALLAAWQIAPVGFGQFLAHWDAWTANVWPWIGAAVGIVVLFVLVYPPAIPQIRSFWARQKARMSFDRKKARDLIQRLQEFPNVPDLQSLGDLYLSSGQPALAIGPLIQAQQLEPGNPRVLLLLARGLREVRQFREAHQAAEAAIDIEPEIAFGAGILLTGECALRLGAAERAYELAADHERRFGESIEGLYMRARAAHAMKRNDEKNQVIDRLLALPPGAGKRYSADEALARARSRIAKASGRQP